ncbi:hypothetical protein AaE_008410 [Aphanomyces astaci]|uniref:DDE-1 domain-containing protein n=1 Tax=Aphanomyces astaci TaxID=112090 RepID=A0A6A5AF07_APHAT|nr:hypothetical protein AaE_008410 [Aphanomyces astaci]
MRTTILPQRVQRRYTIEARLQLFIAFGSSGLNPTDFCYSEGIPRSTWQTWWKKRHLYLNATRNKKRPTLGGQGRPSSILFGSELLAFMQAVRHESHFLTTAHLVTWIKKHQHEWLQGYMSTKTSDIHAYHALLGLCQRFAHRHGFSQRIPCFSKLKLLELEQVRTTFAASFWVKHDAQPLRDIVNVDETAVFYDMPSRRTWCAVGEDSNVEASEKHSDRLTAVMSICADGTKLPILFILRGTPGGSIESDELPTFPEGHVYAVQEKAWMDESVWVFYLQELLKFELIGPSVILVDNLASHVSAMSYKTVDEELFGFLEPLPPNATSHCQPLDVGVMGPLKAKLRSKWLLETPVVTASEKRLKMVERTIAAWDSISTSTVRSSFEKALPRIFEL